jgi:hypothetical protein
MRRIGGQSGHSRKPTSVISLPRLDGAAESVGVAPDGLEERPSPIRKPADDVPRLSVPLWNRFSTLVGCTVAKEQTGAAECRPQFMLRQRSLYRDTAAAIAIA